MNEQYCREMVRWRACQPLDLDCLLEFIPCEVCGEFGNHHEMHHRKFRSRAGRWAASNILLICPRCHLNATNETMWASSHGMNVHSWENPRAVPVKLWWTDDMLLLTDDGGWQRYPAVHDADAGRTH